MHVEVSRLDEMSRMEAEPRCKPKAGRTGTSDFTFQERHAILLVSRFKYSYDAEDHYETGCLGLQNPIYLRRGTDNPNAKV